MKAKNELGNTYGRLTVIDYVGLNNQHRAVWLCKCSCGNLTKVVGKYLRNGDTTSCGCRWKETKEEFVNNCSGKSYPANPNKPKRRKENSCYMLWRSIKKRCYNPNSKSYQWYGEKGITMCDEWKNDYKKFREWCVENGYKDCRELEFKDRLSIDRLDPTKGYYPENCRFITVGENSTRANIYRYHGNTEVTD